MGEELRGRWGRRVPSRWDLAMRGRCAVGRSPGSSRGDRLSPIEGLRRPESALIGLKWGASVDASVDASVAINAYRQTLRYLTCPKPMGILPTPHRVPSRPHLDLADQSSFHPGGIVFTNHYTLNEAIPLCAGCSSTLNLLFFFFCRYAVLRSSPPQPTSTCPCILLSRVLLFFPIILLIFVLLTQLFLCCYFVFCCPRHSFSRIEDP